METDVDKLYDLIYKLNNRISELEKKNEELSEKSEKENDPVEEDVITNQEHIVVDPHSLGEYKYLSMPNGGAIKVKSFPMCVNGRHIITDLSDVVFCSRCGSAICKEHNLDIDPPMCKNCIREEVGALSDVELSVLVAIAKGVSFWRIGRSLKIDRGVVGSAIKSLSERGLVKRRFFSYNTTFDGDRLLQMASLIYDF